MDTIQWNEWVLVWAESGERVRKGDPAGGEFENWTVNGGAPPRHEGSTGKVWISSGQGGSVREYYPSVIKAKWINQTAMQTLAQGIQE